MFKSVQILVMAVCLTVLAPDGARANESPFIVLADGIDEALLRHRPMRDGILTVHDGMLYVQCRNHSASKGWRCEAAGLKGEPWLRNILTADRQEQLSAFGFRPEQKFGNFVRDFPRTTAPEDLVEIIVRVLTEVYGADVDNLRTLVDRVPKGPCPPRLRAGNDRGGSIATPQWGFAQDIVDGCRASKPIHQVGRVRAHAPAIQPPAEAINLEERYATPIAAQIRRLRLGSQDMWATFETDVSYVQCLFDDDDLAIYCEAASEDAVGESLAQVLTPARRQKLLDAGYEPPGRHMNYNRYYPVAEYDDAAVAKALLAVLQDSYGYAGTPRLMLGTEWGNDIPL